MTPFSATLRSEWTKLTSLRSTRVTLALGILLGVGLSGLVAVVAGVTWDDWSAADRRDFDPISFALTGGILSAILFAVLGVTAATSEYSSGMIRQTLTATPRRGRVLAAKAVAVGALMVVAGLVATLAMFLTTQAILASYGIETAGLGDGGALRTVLSDAAISPMLPVVAVALGFALRSTAGALTAVLGLIFAPAIFGGLLPQWWQDNLLAYLPGAAGEALTTGHLEGAADNLIHPAAAVAALAAWLALFLGIGWAALRGRDA